jgi:hypothetical protein
MVIGDGVLTPCISGSNPSFSNLRFIFLFTINLLLRNYISL